MVRCGSRWRSDQSGKYTCPWAAGFNYSISSLSGSSLVLHALPLHGQKVPAPGNVTLDCYGWRAVCLMAVVTAVTVAGRSPPGGGDGGPRDKCGALGIKGDNSRGSGCATWEFHLPGPLLHPGGTWTKVGSRAPAPRCSGGLGLGRGQAFIHVYFSKEPMWSIWVENSGSGVGLPHSNCASRGKIWPIFVPHNSQVRCDNRRR